MRILITGFEPFGDHVRNPSQELVLALPDVTENGLIICKSILPVDQVQAPRILIEKIFEYQPDAILSFGLAAGRVKLSLERVAINLKDFRIPDNAGVTIQDQPIIDGGPTAFFTTLPIRKMHTALKEAAIPTEISLSAGTYLCNQVFYVMMHEISKKQLPIRAGFIHLPTFPEGTSKTEKDPSSWSLDIAIRAAHLLILQL
ncbi:MAG: pyroglutamyl-peptidase I [Anaerolineales bacterium]